MILFKIKILIRFLFNLIFAINLKKNTEYFNIFLPVTIVYTYLSSSFFKSWIQIPSQFKRWKRSAFSNLFQRKIFIWFKYLFCLAMPWDWLRKCCTHLLVFEWNTVRLWFWWWWVAKRFFKIRNQCHNLYKSFAQVHEMDLKTNNSLISHGNNIKLYT